MATDISNKSNLTTHLLYKAETSYQSLFKLNKTSLTTRTSEKGLCVESIRLRPAIRLLHAE